MKRAKAYCFEVVPPPRLPWRWAALLPLLLFLLLYAGICFALEAFDLLLFAAPGAFALMALAPWFWWQHHAGWSGLGRGRGLAALWTRLSVLGLLALVLAQPRAVRISEGLSLLFAVDISDSIGPEAGGRSMEWVLAAATDKPQKDRAGLVVFARDAAVELPPRQAFPFEAINSRIERDGTDLAKALSLSAALLPADQQGRIVLVSDGAATAGRLDPVLDDLASRGIAVDVLPVDYRLDREVWAEKLELPRHVKAGETYEASVVVSALTAGRGRLLLRENGELIAEEEISYRQGKNRFDLPLYMRGPGFYEYAATIATPPGEDFWEGNNTAINQLHLEGEGKVLVVTDSNGDPRDWEHLQRALREAGRQVETVRGFSIGRDPMALMPYDAVVLANVPADAFDVVQMQALRDAVYHLGIGLVMVGGPESFGPGGYHRSPVEEALPVSMDMQQRKVLPKGALAIVLHTCEFPEGNTWGKRITKQAIKVLGDRDEVGVLVYNAGVNWLFPLTPAKEYATLARKVEAAQIGDMPDFDSTMRMGLDGLKDSDAAAKHMIVISDGDPSPPPPPLVAQFQQAGVSISTIAVFPHGGTDISTLRSIAQVTGGRYYHPKDPKLLPRIFIKEAKTLRRSMIQEGDFVPRVGFPSPILKGIDRMPQLHGYVITTPKPRAHMVLQHRVGEGADQERDPVLATWRFGLGKAAAFTSDLAPRWAAEWMGWRHYRGFVEQLIADVSRVNEPSQLYVNVQALGQVGEVVIEDHHPDAGLLELRGRVVDPDGGSRHFELRQVGPARYVGQFPLSGRGRYQVLIAGAGADRQEQKMLGLVVPYSPEYLRFRADPQVLRRVAERTGGRELSGEESGADLFRVPRQPRSSSRSVADWFLVALAILIPLDVAVRRIQIDWSVLVGWFRRRRADDQASSATMGQLLARKREVASSQRSDEPVRPIKPVMPSKRSGAETAAKRESAGSAPSAPPEDPGSNSTMQRLLKRKREVEEEREG